MKRYLSKTTLALFMAALLVFPACHDLLDEPAENRSFTGETDYTLTGNMDLPLLGMYADFYESEWEVFPFISVRGDDVNAGGLGDQQDFAETDKYNYNKDFWMANSVWQNYYGDLFNAWSAMDQIDKYKEFASNKSLADQYKAEIEVMRAWYLYYLTQIWGEIFIPETSNPMDLLEASLVPRDTVLHYIVAHMDKAIPLLPAVHPNERTDIKGGITKFTALALKARASLALKNYATVADATGQIISSGKFTLSTDYYNLFKIPGKLNKENLLELQYSDFGKGSGDAINYLNDFFGPQGWTPKVTGAGSGWGFYEPSLKYIKFMLDRNETIRLETSVLFTNRGITEIKKDAKYANLPAWITNTTRSGDKINDYARAMFASGKHYLPSDQLTPGRTGYGTNKNFICIRYAEILLMHAEALTNGASSSAMTADAAVNLVRTRAGLTALTNVTNAQVMDEKYAELAMEWGIRFYDMVRTGNISALTYDGRTFSADKVYFPYPQNQVDLIPALRAATRN